MDSCSGELRPPVLPDTLRGCQAPSDNTSSCRVTPVSTMKLAPQLGEHPPEKSSCAECGGATTSTRSGSPCGSPFNHHASEGEACLTSSHGQPRSALSCTCAGPDNIKISDVSGGTPVETAPGNPCDSSVLDNDPDHAESRQVRSRKTPGAMHPGCELTSDYRPCVVSGVLRQCSPLCDSGDLSVRTNRPPGIPPTGWMSLADGFTHATSNADNGPPETLRPGCPIHPGSILNDVSGGPPPIAGLDRPCDGSVLCDGPRHSPLIILPPNCMEFAPSPDILHQQVVVQLSAVEVSTFPFHHSCLAPPSSPPPHASAVPDSPEVKATPKQAGVTHNARLEDLRAPGRALSRF